MKNTFWKTEGNLNIPAPINRITNYEGSLNSLWANFLLLSYICDSFFMISTFYSRPFLIWCQRINVIKEGCIFINWKNIPEEKRMYKAHIERNSSSSWYDINKTTKFYQNKSLPKSIFRHHCSGFSFSNSNHKFVFISDTKVAMSLRSNSLEVIYLTHQRVVIVTWSLKFISFGQSRQTTPWLLLPLCKIRYNAFKVCINFLFLDNI